MARSGVSGRKKQKTNSGVNGNAGALKDGEVGIFPASPFFVLFSLKNVSFLKQISFVGDTKNEAELAKSLCQGTGIFCAVGEKAKNEGKTLLKIHVPHGRFYVEMRRFFIYNIECYQVKIDEERF